MGYQKFKRQLLLTRDAKFSTSPSFSTDAGVVDVTQTIALSGVSALGTTAVTSRGITFITSTGTGAGWSLPLAAPGRAGVTKRIFVNQNSTVPVQIHTASSANTFYGSTFNSVTFTTAGGAILPGVVLIAASSVQWAVQSIYPVATTATTYITSTGATA